jgi:glycosyltransferase involved in cell wall biosynthesis
VRILHVVQEAGGGGMTQAVELARHAAARGAQVTLAVPADTDVPNVRVLPRIRAPEIFRLAREADLLHVHGARAAAWSLPALRARPSVVTFHGLHPLRRPAGRAYRTAARALVASAVAAAGAVVAVSRSEAAELESLRIGRAKIRVVRNGVPARPPIGADERATARKALGLGNGELAALFLGRLEEPKDPLAAVRAAGGLGEQGVVLLVAGDGSLSRAVRAAAAENIRLLGHRNDVWTLLAAADVLFNTSVWEGLPFSVLEAMQAGRAVLASDVAGNAEALGEAGRLVPRGDVARFRSELLSLRDAELRQRLGRQARERVAREFPLERMLAGTDEVYAELLRR